MLPPGARWAPFSERSPHSSSAEWCTSDGVQRCDGVLRAPGGRVEVFELAPENEQPPAVETAEAAEQARVSLVTKKVGVFLDGVGIGT